MSTFLISESSLAQELRQSDRFRSIGLTLDSWADDQVKFWYKIFTEYTTDQTLIHDSLNLKRMYEVVTDPKKISTTKNEIHNTLIGIYKKNFGRKAIEVDALTPEEYRYYLIFEATEDPRAYEFASDYSRIRAQIGQKNRLESAYSISKHYLARMEEMFEEEGVPKELTRLPFVESGFIHEAKSSAGAIGIWQFMPKTAQKDLRVTHEIDERYDPLKSTRAAAKFLKQNYRQLGSWPLAVMAYHHGAGLVQKAIRKLNTKDPIRIIREFHHPSFKFASRNYLFEFLAMLDVDAAHQSLFQIKEATRLPAYITVSFPRKMLMKDILKHYSLSESLIQLLNPHLRDAIWSNSRSIPAHYPVRLTGINLEEFRKKGYP